MFQITKRLGEQTDQKNIDTSNQRISDSNYSISQNRSSNNKQFEELKAKRTIIDGKLDQEYKPKISTSEKFVKKFKSTIESRIKSSSSGIIKSRTCVLNLIDYNQFSVKEKQTITKFPKEIKDFLKTGKNLYHNDLNFCYELLKPTKDPYYKFFKNNGLIYPDINKETTEYLLLCYKFLQNDAYKYLLNSFYSENGRLSKVYTDVSEYFERMTNNPWNIGKFKKTSSIHISKTFINKNKDLMDYLSKEDDNGSNNWQITFNTKIVTINSRYFAYRNKVIKNFWFSLLSYYFRSNTIVSRDELVKFLLEDEISTSLVKKLYKKLNGDIKETLRGWKGNNPTWHQFKNELRFFRKKLSNKLLDSEINEFTENDHSKNKEIVEKILDRLKKEEKPVDIDNNLLEFLVSQFISFLNKKSKNQFKRMFNNYYLDSNQVKNNSFSRKDKLKTNRYKNYVLFQKFVNEVTNSYLKENKIEKEPINKANKLWKKMVNKKTGNHYIHELLNNSTPIWQEILDKTDLKQFISERIKIWQKKFEEEFILDKIKNNSNYSLNSGDLPNDIEKRNNEKLNKRVVIPKKIGSYYKLKKPKNRKNNLKFFQKRRVALSMIYNSTNQYISDSENNIFEKALSITPYKIKTENYYYKENFCHEITEKINIDYRNIIPCFESFLRSVIDNKVEEIMRKQFTSKKSEELRKRMNNENIKINYPNPDLKSLNFSTGPATKQLFELDLDNRLFKLSLFKKSLRKGIWYNFSIQDNDTPKKQRITRKNKILEQKFYDLELDNYSVIQQEKRDNEINRKESRLSKFLVNNKKGFFWIARNPTVIFDTTNKDFKLNIPFEKIIKDNKAFNKTLRKNTEFQLNKQIEEIIIGIDQGLSWYAVVSVELIKSKYSKTKEGKIFREIISRKPLRHYYLNDPEVFGISFNQKTGLFNNGSYDNSGRFIKIKSNNNYGKNKFRILRKKIRKRQKKLMDQIMSQNEKTTHLFTDDPQLNSYWEKFHRLQKTLASNLAAKIRDIAIYYQTIYKTENKSYQSIPIRVQVESLKWTTQKPKYKIGYFLSHNNIHFIHSQFQKSLSNLLIENGIGLWTINPYNTSKICSLCHHHDRGVRFGKNFFCNNPDHKIGKNKPYSCNADLNAARNIAQFPPLSLKAINSTN